jgi:hypothetical protein
MTGTKKIGSRISKRWCLVWFCLCSNVVSARERFAQDAREQLDRRVTEFVGHFDDPHWETRATAFYDLLSRVVRRAEPWLMPSAFETLFKANLGRKDQISLALIRLLETENVFHRGDKNPSSEEFRGLPGGCASASFNPAGHAAIAGACVSSESVLPGGRPLWVARAAVCGWCGATVQPSRCDQSGYDRARAQGNDFNRACADSGMCRSSCQEGNPRRSPRRSGIVSRNRLLERTHREAW